MFPHIDKRKALSLGLVFAFLANSLGPLPAKAEELYLPQPGVRVSLSPEFNPPVLKGLKVHPDNPFRFDFILDKGDVETQHAASLQDESMKLIKYFLASLTVPEQDLWVNLSPYEKDRIVPTSFGLTEMGRDLLAQDYLLKQITASLIYPEDDFGKKFWKRVYEEASKRFGTTDIPVNTFNKVWIVPEKAVVYENARAGTAYVVESKLKVMLEEDYLALANNQTPTRGHVPAGDVSPGTLPSERALNTKAPQGNNLTASPEINALGSQIVREIVIPQLTKEVNENKNFSQLRQVYNSLILATWYKKKIKSSILNKVYADKNKISGITYTHTPTRGHVPAGDVSPSALPSKPRVESESTLGQPLSAVPPTNDVEAIYQQYLQAFKKGVYNYIKEETDPITQQVIPRKYFSGGFNMDMAMLRTTTDAAMVGHSKDMLNVEVNVRPAQAPPTPAQEDRAMSISRPDAAMEVTTPDFPDHSYGKFFTNFEGPVYYPASELDLESIVLLAKLFPKLTKLVYVDVLDPDEMNLSTYFKPEEDDAPGFHAYRYYGSKDLPLLQRQMKRKLAKFRYRGKAIIDQNKTSVEIVSVQRMELRLQITFEKDIKSAPWMNGRAIKIKFLVRDIFDYKRRFDAIYVNFPGYSGGLALNKRFWEAMHRQISARGYLVETNQHSTTDEMEAFKKKHFVRLDEASFKDEYGSHKITKWRPLSSVKGNGAQLSGDQAMAAPARGPAPKPATDQAVVADVISIVQHIESVEQVEDLFKEVKYLKAHGAQVSKGLLSALETMAILFGFESGPNMDIIDSYGSLFKNWQVSSEDREEIWRRMYAPANYPPSFGTDDDVQYAIYRALSGLPREKTAIYSRFKQYKSILEKLRSAIAKIEGVPIDRVPEDTRGVFDAVFALKDKLQENPMGYFDDLIGFNIEIDDTRMDEDQRVAALTEVSGEVERLLSQHSDWKMVKVRKGGRAKGYESVNVWVFGLLNHKDFGTLPVKIQIRFLSALKHEAAMRYIFKTTGKWEYPPWITESDVNAAVTFEDLRKTLFRNFKAYAKTQVRPERFDLLKHIDWPLGMPHIFVHDWINRLAGSAQDKAMAGEAKKGGIDFTADKTPLEVQNSGEGINFHIDPAMFKQLQDAPGFVPVIISIQPLNSLPEFLGLSSNVNASAVTG